MEEKNEQLRFMKLQTYLLIGILAVVLAVAIYMTVQFAAMRSCIDLIEKDVQAVDMEALNGAVDSFTEAADQLAGVDVTKLNETAAALQTAADTFKGVDIGEFNKTVVSLQKAADQFGSVDVDALNKLVTALETVSEKLQNAVNGITGIFRR